MNCKADIGAPKSPCGLPREAHTQFSQRRLLVWGAEVSHLGARFIVVIGVFLQSPIGQIGPPPSKSLSIEPCRALTFDVNAPPSMLHVRGDFGLLSDHEMNDRARPGRSEYCRIPTVGLTIGEPCERRQQNERYGANCRAGGRNVGKKQRALYV